MTRFGFHIRWKTEPYHTILSGRFACTPYDTNSHPIIYVSMDDVSLERAGRTCSLSPYLVLSLSLCTWSSHLSEKTALNWTLPQVTQDNIPWTGFPQVDRCLQNEEGGRYQYQYQYHAKRFVVLCCRKRLYRRHLSTERHHIVGTGTLRSSQP